MHAASPDHARREPGAPPIRGNVPGSFAWSVLHQRHPALIQQVRDAYPYPPEHQRALDQLAEEITGRIEPLPDDAHDRADWQRWGRGYLGQPWAEVPFLWAESYFYRKLLHAVGYFGHGPWRGIDPFEPVKTAELTGRPVDADLAALDALAGRPAAERSAALLHAALWGNQADLGFRLSDPGAATREPVTELVADDSALLWELLAAGSTGTGAGTGAGTGTGTHTGSGTHTGTGADTGTSAGTVCVVADNAGRELLADLALIDHLLDSGLAARVELHLKPCPYYVSDATTGDAVACLRRLVAAAPGARAVGRRLWRALVSGRLAVHTHWFYRAPWSYHRMPGDLAERFAAAKLTILKGDLNYRRLVGDLEWPATASFTELTGYFPGPVVTLRTLKSDVVVGLDEATVAALDASREPWRVSGTHALIQARA